MKDCPVRFKIGLMNQISDGKNEIVLVRLNKPFHPPGQLRGNQIRGEKRLKLIAECQNETAAKVYQDLSWKFKEDVFKFGNHQCFHKRHT